MPALLPEYEWQIAYGPQDDPLNRFYIPALQRSVRYDRSAGFFSSSALAVAASGVSGLIANGGTMRLLVGAQLSEEDVQAILRGASLGEVVAERLLAALQGEMDDLLRRRVEILAWMVANGTLQIKVVVQRDEFGQPVANGDYYHPKTGIFTDAAGNQMAFVGSVNESLQAWMKNYERFSVYFSWDVTRPYLMNTLRDFERVWNGEDAGWIAMDIPEAVHRSLIHYAPDRPPSSVDPLAGPPTEEEAELERERLIIQFLRDMPHFPNNYDFGMATAPITPWPHQAEVARKIIRTYPRNYMLCDEVGLGKTIEAGLVLRQLLLSGLVKRCLLLVPRSVTRQWQEELYEKFVLDIPLFDGQHFWNYAGEQLPIHGDNPWDAYDVFIASSQLAKRRDRQAQVLAARPWDLVVVDEAHHARRKDFLQPQYRPNRLLELLTHPDFQTRSMLLITATPMQVHALEVWDLLDVLGALSGKWGADERNFLQFYTHLRLPVDMANWDFVFSMVRDYLEHGGELDERFAAQARKALGPVNWERLRNLPYAHRPSQEVQRLPREVYPYLEELARRHTPLGGVMFRNTRDLLREYAKQGVLKERIPYRDPQLVWIAMRDEEMRLYHRIEEYITHFYRKYEAKRRGLGFVMTVYRRRLTSSFYAVRRSLERRLEFLRTGAGLLNTLDSDDLEQDDLALDIAEELEDTYTPQDYQDEIAYVGDFLYELLHLSMHDSKVEQLLQDLDRLLRKRSTVIIFTQYTDTMDYLRDKLQEVYGDQVACYSGRGGEKWNGIAWIPVPKEQIKREFRDGEHIKILVCTEAASEGLNLQTCGVLINYDMPWNPMRVEQRIGRLDRIGQLYDRVWIRNYFYEDTIEARVYQALAGRIHWFEGVVGSLQPILARVSQAIQQLAMSTFAEREELFHKTIAEIERKLDEQDDFAPEVYEAYHVAGPYTATALSAPSLLGEIESFLLNSRHFGERFRPHPYIRGAYVLATPDGEVNVTFDARLFDEYPNSLYLLSYGSSLFNDLLSEAKPPKPQDNGALLRLSTEQPMTVTAYYRLADLRPVHIRSLTDLYATIESTGTAPSPSAMLEAERDFKQAVRRIWEQIEQVTEFRYKGNYATLIEQANRVLAKATVVDLVREQRLAGAVDPEIPPTFTERMVRSLERHGHPFDHLLQMVGNRISLPDGLHELYGNALQHSPERLNRAFKVLKQEGHKLLDRASKLARRKRGVVCNPEEINCQRAHYLP